MIRAGVGSSPRMIRLGSVQSPTGRSSSSGDAWTTLHSWESRLSPPDLPELPSSLETAQHQHKDGFPSNPLRHSEPFPLPAARSTRGCLQLPPNEKHEQCHACKFSLEGGSANCAVASAAPKLSCLMPLDGCSCATGHEPGSPAAEAAAAPALLASSLSDGAASHSTSFGVGGAGLRRDSAFQVSAERCAGSQTAEAAYI